MHNVTRAVIYEFESQVADLLVQAIVFNLESVGVLDALDNLLHFALHFFDYDLELSVFLGKVLATVFGGVR